MKISVATKVASCPHADPTLQIIRKSQEGRAQQQHDYHPLFLPMPEPFPTWQGPSELEKGSNRERKFEALYLTLPMCWGGPTT